MKRLILSFLLPFFFCISCDSTRNNNRDNLIEMDSAYFEIDLSAKSLPTPSSQEIIDTVIYLQLETNSESEFSQITQLEVIEKYYIILDKEANGIFFFHKDGSYAKRISPFNRDIPVPFERVLGFTIDPYRDILSFNDIHTDKIYRFDLEGNFVDIRKKTEQDYYKDDFSLFQGYELSIDLFNHRTEKKKKAYPAVVVQKDQTSKIETLPYHPNTISYSEIIGNEKYFFRKDSLYLLFCRPYDYIIYKFDSNNMLTEYAQVVFPPEKRLPEDFLTNDRYKGKREQYIQNNTSIRYSISDVYESGNWITFRTFSKTIMQFFLFDKSTRQIFDPSKLISDSSTYYLPVFGTKIHGVDSNYFISSLSAVHLIHRVSSHIGKEGFMDKLPESLKNVFHRGNNQNEVLVLTKFKN